MATYRILIADDDEDDFLLLQQAFEDVGEKHELIYVKDGQELLDYLDTSVKNSEALPDLVILDINMPKVTGDEALAQLRSNPCFIKLPVIMHSTCGDKETERRCRVLGACDFSIKGLNYSKILDFAHRVTLFLDKLRKINDYCTDANFISLPEIANLFFASPKSK